jgi:hypothetical protein
METFVRELDYCLWGNPMSYFGFDENRKMILL